jgi:hypothetical protein
MYNLKTVINTHFLCGVLFNVHFNLNHLPSYLPPADPLPLISVPNALEELEHWGMNPECKKSILTWLRESCNQIQIEEAIIQATINEICTLFK